MIIGKVYLKYPEKNDVHNNYETDYRLFLFHKIQTVTMGQDAHP